MEQKRKKLEGMLSIIKLVTVSLCIILLCCSSWLAKNVFCYDVKTTVTVEKPYEHVIGTVSTYVCYITTYGEKYHAWGCGSLWNSAYETTVYEAEKRGYEPCSKCTPRDKTTIKLTETRYKEVEREKRITKEPEILVWLVGTSGILLFYYISAKCLEKRIESLPSQAKQSNREE